MSSTSDLFEAAPPEPTPLSATYFANFVAQLSRLLHGLGAHPQLRASGLGLSEWIALVQLSEKPVAAKSLARELGVTKQRVAQLTDSLKVAGYIDVVKSSDDARQSDITITPAGRRKVDALNAEMTRTLAEALHGKELTVTRADRAVKLLARVFREPRATPEQKAAAAAAKLAREAEGAKGGKGGKGAKAVDVPRDDDDADAAGTAKVAKAGKEGEAARPAKAAKATDDAKAGKPVDAAKAGKPVDAAKAGKPVDAAKAGKPVDAVKAGKPADAAKSADAPRKKVPARKAVA